MTQTLAEFLDALDQHAGRIPLHEITHRLQALTIELDDVRDFLSFGRDTYRRNMLHAGPAYHALVLCWRNGQRSPIHDHRGSSCGVRVLRGVATETQFKKSGNGLIYATSSRELIEGSVCASQDDDVHQMSNLQPGDAALITVHIYSPPLLVMGRYSLTDPSVAEFVDPIFEFALGGGI